jgi:hypothetical protein
MSSGPQIAADSRARRPRTTARQSVSTRLVSKTRSGELASFRTAKARQPEPAQQVNKAQSGNWLRFVQAASSLDLGLASFRTTPQVLTPASFRPRPPSNEVR